MSEVEGVARSTRRGMSWNLAGAVVTNGLRLVVIAVLGRALSSKDFGIVAAAISVNVVFYSIRDIGVGRALIQRKVVDREHLATAFAVSTYLGVLLFALVALAAPWIGDLYRIQDSVPVMRALALLFVLRGVAIASRMMLQRAMDFRRVAIIDAGSYAVGSVVSMVLAVGGMGPWSLVAGYLLEEAVSSALYIAAKRPYVSFRINRAKLADLMQFGAGHTVSQITNTLAGYGDNMVVGHSLGARMLGYYTRAYDLIKFPSAVFDNLVGNVLFPAFSRFQDDRGRLAVSFRRSLFANALVLFPASALLIVTAPEMIRLLMGPGWGEAVLPFRILAVTMLMRTSWKVGVMIASAAGWMRAVATLSSIYMVFVIGGAIVTVRWDIVGVATSTAIAITVIFIGSLLLAMRVSGLGLLDVIKAHLPGLWIAVIIAVCAWPAAQGMRSAHFPVALIFALTSVGAALATLAMIWACVVRGRGDFQWLAGELARIRAKLRGAPPHLPT